MYPILYSKSVNANYNVLNVTRMNLRNDIFRKTILACIGTYSRLKVILSIIDGGVHYIRVHEVHLRCVCSDVNEIQIKEYVREKMTIVTLLFSRIKVSMGEALKRTHTICVFVETVAKLGRLNLCDVTHFDIQYTIRTRIRYPHQVDVKCRPVYRKQF
jgi:hypothetical protein